MNRYTLSFISLPLLLSSALSAKDLNIGQYFTIQDNETPGCGVGIVQSDKLIEQLYVGQSNIRYQVPIDNKTVFDIGSVSKHMTAYIIMALESEGLLSQKQTLADFYKDGPDWFNNVTLFHLIHHQSGIPDYLNDTESALYLMKRLKTNYKELNTALWGGIVDKSYLFSEIVGFSKQLKSPTFTPGTSISYSNTGYVLLADIIEKVTNNKFEDEIASRIFIPLKMSNTQASTKDNFLINWKASSYYVDKYGNYAHSHTMLPSQGDGGIQSTVPDMAKWMEHLIKPKYADEAREKLLALSKGEYPAFTAYWGAVEFKMGGSKYVNGLIAKNLYGGEFYSHSGYSLDGMVTEFWFSPEREIGYIQMCNYKYLKMPPLNNIVQQYGKGN
ncbi:serine hydrolase domain-containing protein [Aliivibrio fischeri]|uniref:serine hydrolase domain-containing protein n=1 Tax=Aliivibrio fischeri TaxID=668 RepID=UPI001F2D79D1|nr:serine hydrolase domain-containing protein [Aliivibrio fischeri]MCE4934508.1 beta-lactamase family protein [Aliivibrio fischeri]